MNRKCWKIAVMAVLSAFLLSVEVLAQEGDEIRLDETGTVTLTSQEAAGAGVSSLQIGLRVDSAEGEKVEFIFAESNAKILEFCYDEGAKQWNLYLAGTEALFAKGSNTLTLGRVVVLNGNGEDVAATVSIQENSAWYVYGTELRSIEALKLPQPVVINEQDTDSPEEDDDEEEDDEEDDASQETDDGDGTTQDAADASEAAGAGSPGQGSGSQGQGSSTGTAGAGSQGPTGSGSVAAGTGSQGQGSGTGAAGTGSQGQGSGTGTTGNGNQGPTGSSTAGSGTGTAGSGSQGTGSGTGTTGNGNQGPTGSSSGATGTGSQGTGSGTGTTGNGNQGLTGSSSGAAGTGSQGTGSGSQGSQSISPTASPSSDVRPANAEAVGKDGEKEAAGMDWGIVLIILAVLFAAVFGVLAAMFVVKTVTRRR